MVTKGMLKKIREILTKGPGLRGREIAQKAGLDRKEVNSFLHKHKDIFVQDDNYCWSLIGPLMLELDSYWVTADSFEQSLAKTGCLLSSEAQTISIKIPDGCKIILAAGARLLSLLNQLIHIGKFVTVDLQECADTKSFLSRAGFFDLLDDQVNVIPSRPKFPAAKLFHGNSSALVEFGSIDPKKKNNDLIIQLVDRFVHQSSTRYQTAAATVFGELIGNVVEHSDTPINGFAALQKYEGKKKHIQTVVSDSGLGIAKTLRPSLEEHYGDLYKLYKEETVKSNAGLVKTALCRGGISRFGAGRGLGFQSSSGQASKFDAEFSVRQERFYLNFKYKNGELVDIDSRLNIPKILGTHLCFDFFVD
jgi:signal transduction histidine kinase